MQPRHHAGLAAEHDAVASVMHEHDHRRIGAREALGAAVGIGALAHVAGLDALGRGAALAAEAVAVVPGHHRPGEGDHAALLRRHPRAHLPQIVELSMLAERRLGMVRDVHGEMRDPVHQA